MNSLAPIKYEREIPDILLKLGTAHTAVQSAIDNLAVPRAIYHLIKLRASQINGCAHCVKMHLHEARADGESDERLDRLVVWRHVDDFNPAERAALAWTEALTTLDPAAGYGALRGELRAHYDDKQIGTLTAVVAMINLWNRLRVSQH
ncbi:MAG: carboxymuconolactone decarboxylase family protein [Lysobacter sp.]